MNGEKKQNLIRNFCIIAHIDHGKSTLSDRFLEITKTVEKRKMQEQLLDTMSLERERGITIKMQPVRMDYKHTDGKDYILNLIDTPGHVDFSYEVSRSIAAVEGAVLLIDATKGMQAQTLAVLEQAQKQNLVIIPAVNKIDLPNAMPKEVKAEISNFLMIEESEILEISGKTGAGVPELLCEIIKKIPAPKGREDAPLKALVFDSVFDAFKGVIANVRIVDGSVKRHEKIRFMVQKTQSDVLECGAFKPSLVERPELLTGEIGYIATGLKEIGNVRVGDTITLQNNPASENLPGYKEVQPVVFASLFPQDADDYDFLRDGLLKLRLNDSSLSFEPEQSEAFGRGFRCGFLGMLHMDIVKERLKREFNIDPLVTIPSVSYNVKLNNGTEKLIYSPAQMPDPTHIKETEEPYVRMEIITRSEYVGGIMGLLDRARGIYKETQYLTQEKILLLYEAPLSEIIVDFFDDLKSVTSGYASLNYELIGFKKAELVKLDMLVAGEPVEALSRVVVKIRAQEIGKTMVAKLKDIIPRQLFAVSLQAAVGGKILAREDLSAMRKDVTGYLYGGDVTRKKKLLEKQKKGKKKMKAMGKVNIPPEVYFKVLKK
ncbi:elongation factor 4 [Candidatus Azambacteria bacterium]|nr:elongation factor 4 [Candidatus Azambacteria bacterium]